MRKILGGLSVLAFLSWGVSAAESATALVAQPEEVDVVVIEEVPYYPWTFINLQFFPEVPTEAENTITYGVKVGAPVSSGEAPVYGVEAAVISAGTDVVNGLQCSMVMCNAEEVNGIQFSLVNMSFKVGGLQLGIVNIAKDAKLQIGLLNFMEDGSFPCLPIFNFNF
ncbi:MAG: hypothetical protein LBM70_06645 [Victivallales bacterium]|jgi:hypothetical protein|nr:hypothetical protein [Victivallales bacterium]